jgi:chemotaxis signal transduction protein
VTLHRGLALPVYDLERLPALWAEAPGAGARESGEAPHVVVCGYGEVLVGLRAGAPDLIGAPDPLRGAPAGPVEAVRADFVSEVRRDGSELVAILDPSRLFASLGVPGGAPADREGA